MTPSFSDLRPGLLTYGLDRPPTSVGRYAIELITSLHDLGAQPVLLGNPASFLPHVERYRRFPMTGAHSLPGLVTIGNFVIHYAVRKGGLNLVHDPTGNAPFLFGAERAKMVVTIHDVFARTFSGSSTLMENIITRYWLPAVLPHVDAIITNSQASKNDIIRHLGIAEDKIHVIYLAGGRDIHPIHRTEMAAILARYDVEPGFILMIGSLDKRRNLPRLLEAYSRLRQQGEHRPLVVIGRHQHGPDLRPALLEKFGLTGFVHFVGYVAARDLPAFYSAADLFVFPSLYEGFGTPTLEAMACGTPVVCSNTTSLPEVVGDAAILVDPQSVDAIADGMQRVLADPDLRADLRIRGFIRADEFSWERTAQKTLEVYQKVF